MESALTHRQRTPRSPSAAGFAPPEFCESTIDLTEFAFCREPDENRLGNADCCFSPVMDSEAQHCAHWMPMVSIRGERAGRFQLLCSFSKVRNGELGNWANRSDGSAVRRGHPTIHDLGLTLLEMQLEGLSLERDEYKKSLGIGTT
jgi:hypothetical protein